LAELAKIEFSEEELEKFLSDLNRILRYIDEIKELDLSRFEPMVGGPVQKLELREDKIENYDKEKKDMIVNQFPQKENNYLRAPKIISKS
ncbi:MAG: Asp-tRNA(Asn)/Glu-tRNA(Gln) amidotransferase subunit GatC, partial [Patescibacteria group bacterium]|nr:Asp-tRNA(Asn)/Glu-tRNA(Gln) amidotransferase subunit GatC [Patescibacteria group bacterium]